MNPAQQQIVDQWNQFLQQLGGQIQGLLGQAAGGCQQLIAQNPMDPSPLGNALGAVGQQARDLGRKSSDTFSQFYDRICAAGPGEPAYSQMKRGARYFDIWVDEAWERFEIQWQTEAYRAMWPYVQQALAKPIACNRCGAPLPQRQKPNQSETINCASCRSANQVMPEAVVARYYGAVPHFYAAAASFEKKYAITKFRAEWEDRRDAEYAADRERSDEPLERLQQREKMELDHWTTYAETKAKYEGGTPADVKSLVEARMKQSFYDDMNMNDVWRAAHGQQSVIAQVSVPANLRGVDEFGPINPQSPTALEDDLVHDQLLSEAMREPARYESLLKALGYRDAQQRAMVHATFQRHYEAFLMSDQGIALMTKSAMRAMNERAKYAVAAGAASGLLDPIEGVSLQIYANLQAKQAGAKPEAFQQLLAQHQMDQATWERVQKGWIDKMSKDTTGAVATEYSKAFMSAGQGQYGAAAQATAAAMGDGVVGAQGPAANAEPMTFEKYCEVSGAMSAWSKQGKDISAMLDKHFKMTAMDVSSVSMYWSQRMMQDMSMFEKQSQLTTQFEQRYLSM